MDLRSKVLQKSIYQTISKIRCVSFWRINTVVCISVALEYLIQLHDVARKLFNDASWNARGKCTPQD